MQKLVKLRAVGWRTYLLIAAVTFCSAGVFWVSSRANHDSRQEAVLFQPPAPLIWPLPTVFGATSPGTSHTVFPYSVIAGGADSPQELRDAVLKDPVVAQHYSDFNLATARRMILDAPQMMYVSYRIGNEVFWTKHQITLRKGETLLTDGHSMARTRCGNRVAVLPIRPNSPTEPTAEEFEAPVIPPANSTPYLAAYSAPPFPLSSGFVPSAAGLPPGLSGGSPNIPFFPYPGGGGVNVGGKSSTTPTPPGGGGGGTPPGGGSGGGGGTPPGGGSGGGGGTPPGGGSGGGGGTPPGGGSGGGGGTPPGGGSGGGGGTPPGGGSGGGGGTPPGGGSGGGGGTPPVGVPEPATATLLLTGLVSALAMRRRRKAC